MAITDQRVTDYLNGLYKAPFPFLEKLREEAENEGIPILLRDTERLIQSLLRIRKPKRILEIGTAIGYSALCFAMAVPEAEIVTCEVRPELAARAQENIRKAEEALRMGSNGCGAGAAPTGDREESAEEGTCGRSLSRRIRVVCGDAAETLVGMSGGAPFDFVFLDGAHGHYRKMWDAFRPLCVSGTIIVSDNVLFKGMTASDEFLDCRRNRTIMNRMREYLDYITTCPELETSVLPVGDGAAISIVRETSAD